MRLLLVEDDRMIGRSVRRGLMDCGFVVDWVTDGQSGLNAAANGVYDLIVLDLGLPRIGGLELLRSLRERKDSVPVLIATARDAIPDRIAGLNAGADDYLLKPFDLDEMIARVRAVLRRRVGNASPVLEVGDVMLDPIRRQVMQSGCEIGVTAKEFAVLEALMRQPGAVLSRERLEESIYGWAEDIGSNAVEVHLHNLRKKLGSKVILNIRGVGYRMVE